VDTQGFSEMTLLAVAVVHATGNKSVDKGTRDAAQCDVRA